MNDATNANDASPIAALKRVHPFERANLGVAPFKYDGYSIEKYQACPGAPIQPGTCCDYCSTGIMEVHYIKSADGRRFKVGSDCINKLRTDGKSTIGLSRADIALLQAAARAMRDINHTKAVAKAKAVKTTVESQLANEAVRLALTALPHPRGFVDRTTGNAMTLLDWAEWMMQNAGAAGRAKVAKAIKAVIK